MGSPLTKDLVVVTGKGGVGRSTVAAALGLAAAASGKRTILCEVSEHDRISKVFGPGGIGPTETELAENLWGIAIDPQEALKEWLRRQLPGPLARIVSDSSAFQYFVAAAPGARELITIGKVWDLTQLERWDRNHTASYDLVIVDAPASGHGLAMLRTPKTFGDIARVGPIHRQAQKIWTTITDPSKTAYLAVALPEEMPVNETVEFEAKLADALGVRLDAVIVNELYPQRFSAQDATRIEAVAEREARPEARGALLAALSEHRRTRAQQSQLRRLRRATETRVVTLPFVFAPKLERAHLEALGAELARKLAG